MNKYRKRKFFCHHCHRNYSFSNGFEGYRDHVKRLHLPCPYCEKELRIVAPVPELAPPKNLIKRFYQWEFYEREKSIYARDRKIGSKHWTKERRIAHAQ